MADAIHVAMAVSMFVIVTVLMIVTMFVTVAVLMIVIMLMIMTVLVIVCALLDTIDQDCHVRAANTAPDRRIRAEADVRDPQPIQLFNE